MFVDGRIVTAPPRDRLSPGPLGVRTHIPHRCFRGYTLFNPAFGSRAYLIDMNGLVVHTWPARHSQYAELLPNGDLLMDKYTGLIFEEGERGLEQLAPDGQRVWNWEGPYHHDFHRLDKEAPGAPSASSASATSAAIACLIHRRDRVLPGFYAKGYEPEFMLSDVAIAIDRKGKVLWEFPFRAHIDKLRDLTGLPLPVRYMSRQGPETTERVVADWAHANTLEVLPETPVGQLDRRFRAGNILFSLRSLDIIGVADLDLGEIVWAWGLGTLDGQHQPTMTPEGRILLFDNGTARGYSAVIELDPSNSEEVWRYEDRAGFFSAYRSGVQRLPNGNTLITESDAGRIFEVTAEKQVVWDYHSPFLAEAAGGQGRHIYRATRYSEEQVAPLLAARGEDRVVGVSTPNHTPLRTYSEMVRFYRDGLGG